MALIAADFFNGLAKLLPKGPAWDIEDGIIKTYLEGWSQEFARIQARIGDLINEADPRTCYELLADYERVFGLPTTCMAGISQTLEQRRAALVAQMTSIGGQSRAYFIGIAAAAGYTITISEFDAFTVGSSVADPIYGDEWRFAWQVNAPLDTVTLFTVLSGVSEPLASWGNEQLECLINRYKPAHTTVLFSYI